MIGCSQLNETVYYFISFYQCPIYQWFQGLRDVLRGVFQNNAMSLGWSLNRGGIKLNVNNFTDLVIVCIALQRFYYTIFKKTGKRANNALEIIGAPRLNCKWRTMSIYMYICLPSIQYIYYKINKACNFPPFWISSATYF